MGAYELWFGKGGKKALSILWELYANQPGCQEDMNCGYGLIFFCSYSSGLPLLALEATTPVPYEFSQSWTTSVELRVYIFPVNEGVFFSSILTRKLRSILNNPQLFVYLKKNLSGPHF